MSDNFKNADLCCNEEDYYVGCTHIAKLTTENKRLREENREWCEIASDDDFKNLKAQINELESDNQRLKRELVIRENSEHFQWAKNRIAELEEYKHLADGLMVTVSKLGEEKERLEYEALVLKRQCYDKIRGEATINGLKTDKDRLKHELEAVIAQRDILARNAAAKATADYQRRASSSFRKGFIKRADIAEAEVERLEHELAKATRWGDSFKRIGQQFESDSRKFFEQSCKNLVRAESAERKLSAAQDKINDLLQQTGHNCTESCEAVKRLERELAQANVDKTANFKEWELWQDAAKRLEGELDDERAANSAMEPRTWWQDYWYSCITEKG